MARKKAAAKQDQRKNVTFKDVQIAFLFDGVGGVAALTRGRASASRVIRRAVEELKAQGRNVSALEGYLLEQFGSGGGRGRSAPVAGLERKYTAQQVEAAGGPFLRLPLAPLSVKKGGAVRVRFEAERIVVMKA